VSHPVTPGLLYRWLWKLIGWLAYASTLGTGVSYAIALKNYEAGIPDRLRTCIEQLQAIAGQENCCCIRAYRSSQSARGGHMRFTGWHWPPWSCCSRCSMRPLLSAGHIASRTLPDAPNVVSFWRMIVGLCHRKRRAAFPWRGDGARGWAACGDECARCAGATPK
jgi:hypothetical protein